MTVLPLRRAAIAAGALAIVAGCAALGFGGAKASAKLEPTRGSTVSGSVTFLQQGDKVLVVADVSGLPPATEHGFHIHEKGDCSSGDGMSAGGHFNPFGKEHGMLAASGPHAGDMPNLRADGSGHAHLEATLDLVTVSAGPISVVGKSVIVHAQPDDYRSQPAGNAGARLACGVIRRT